MSKISETFNKLKKEGRVALIPYITAGFPNLAQCENVITTLAEYSDLIEIGIPFSDPLADGPTIQRSSQIALTQGVSTPQIFDMIRRLSVNISIPLIIMTYYNSIYRYGLEEFAKQAAEAGISGVIIPDLTVEESNAWRNMAKNFNLDTIFLLAPTSTNKRIDEIVAFSEGFIYLVSLTGVTGAREALPQELSQFIQRIRARTMKPLAVGFGISTPAQAKMIAESADGVIIGSALISTIDENESEENQIASVRRFMAEMKVALGAAEQES